MNLYTFFAWLVEFLYFFITLGLFIYGLNFLLMAAIAHRRNKPLTLPPAEQEWPLVTVQLPLYNELYVAERIIEAAVGLDYPADKLQIQVLDDSNDETIQIVQAAVNHWQAQGVNIQHIRRPNRVGYKAGALQAGLETAQGEFIAIFDADFVPPADFLKRLLPRFTPQTAFVQARWGHLNRDYSILTHLQAIAIDAHFSVEQVSRWSTGLWFNFNGTAGVWRRTAMEDAGGWSADTLTEDLDLSYRAMLKGWQGHYEHGLEVPAELPVSMSGFRRQQHRWARGSFECALKLIKPVLQAPAPLYKRLGAFLHLGGYGVHLLLFGASLLYLPLLYLIEHQFIWLGLFYSTYIFGLTAFSSTLFFLAGQQQVNPRWWKTLPQVFFVTISGSGLMLNTVRAGLQILVGTKISFERTAKFGVVNQPQAWMSQKYQLPKLDSIIFFEILFGAYNFFNMAYAYSLGVWGIAFFAGIFAIGLFYAAGMSFGQSINLYLTQRTSPLVVNEVKEMMSIE